MDKTLLIVDDQEPVIRMVTDLFVADGYRVESASNGEEALLYMTTHRAPVVVTDLSMPQMDGVTFCKKVREVNPVSVMIALTGYHTMFELATCRECGFDDYLRKPVDLLLLKKVVDDGYEKVRRWMEQASTE